MSLHAADTDRDMQRRAGASSPVLGANGPAFRGQRAVSHRHASGRRRKKRQTWLERLARLAVARPKAVLTATLVLMIAALGYGSGISEHLSGGGFYSVSSESQRAAALLEKRFHAGKPNLVVLATNTDGGSVDDPDAVAAGQALTQQLAATPGITTVNSYWRPGKSELLRSTDMTKALIVAHVEGNEREFEAAARRLIATYRDTERGPLKLELGGEVVSYVDVTDQLNHDLGISEAIALPVILLLMTLVFGSLVAAGLPLVIGVLSIVGSLGLLALMSDITPVSNYALNVTTILGLALAIDYSLLVLTRFREERTRAETLDDAIIESVRTAGRTVVFSATTVTLSVLALLVFPMMFLRSIAYACVGVILLATGCALVVTPAMLRILGPRIDSLNVGRAIRRLFGRRAPAGTRAEEDGFWFRSSRLVMRRPVVMGGAVLILALVLAAPFSAIRLNFPDDRSLPTTIESRSVGDVVRAQFPAQATAAMDVILEASADADQLDPYAMALSRLPHVAAVKLATANYVNGRHVGEKPVPHADGPYLTVVPDVDPYSDAAHRLLDQVRRTPSPGTVHVGGLTAENFDTKDALLERIPLAAALIAVAMFGVLFAFTGSVVLPLKALLLNIISLSATLGAMVFIFQEGHLKWLGGDFTVTGTLPTPTPILIICLTFGLSMDYEVFLLSRITEEYRAHGDTNLAVMSGLQRVGPIVTAAALMMSIVFIAMATSQVSFIKSLGLGLTLAILFDATLIRAVLMPAAMRLMGRANWWAPHWRRRPPRPAATEHGRGRISILSP
ncbi:MMPL family transporter [Mycobacterium sp.]|uniref:MMPL family transporter n=1 Tax=Mycobacterium sp. TaxID=1785 RepID=UPI003D0DD942